MPVYLCLVEQWVPLEHLVFLRYLSAQMKSRTGTTLIATGVIQFVQQHLHISKKGFARKESHGNLYRLVGVFIIIILLFVQLFLFSFLRFVVLQKRWTLKS